MRIVRERGTRFLERKLCKELYTVVAVEAADMMGFKRKIEKGLCIAI